MKGVSIPHAFYFDLSQIFHIFVANLYNMRWDDLNMGDKSRMIKLAVDSGITDLRTIRDVYNSYAEGGPKRTYEYYEDDPAFVGPAIPKDMYAGPLLPPGYGEAPIDWDAVKSKQRYMESTYNDRAYNRGSQAKGAFQITPVVLQEYTARTGNTGDLYDPVFNEEVRDWYMNVRLPEFQALKRGHPSDSVRAGIGLASFNAGPGSVNKALTKAQAAGVDTDREFGWLDYLPKETQDYVNFGLRNKDIPNTSKTEARYKATLDSLGIEYATGGHLYGPGGFTKFITNTAEKALSDENRVRKVASFAERHPKTTAKVSRAVRSIIPEDNLFSAAVLAHKHAWSPNPIHMINTEYSIQKAPVESPTGSIYGEWGDPGNSYLLSPKGQQKYMERLGYKMLDPNAVSEADYGLVKRAATLLGKKLGRAIPIYQKGDDYTTRENLMPVYSGNNDDAFYDYVMQYNKDNRETGLSHAGAYPFTLYQIPGEKEYVYKAWDLNDYGNNTPGGTTYSASETIDEKDHQYLANLYDILGEPFVQTTGYTHVPGLSGKIMPSQEEYNRVYNEVIKSGRYTMDRNKATDNGYYTDKETMQRDIDIAVAKKLFDAGYVPFISNVHKNGESDIKALGGKIHIKPENRGKFTALKKRTGHSASWFKAYGTPAQRKMATFALNARKWKHGDGGLLTNTDIFDFN